MAIERRVAQDRRGTQGIKENCHRLKNKIRYGGLCLRCFQLGNYGRPFFRCRTLLEVGVKSTPVARCKLRTNIPLNTRRSSTRGIPCDSRKNGSIRRICFSDNSNSSLMAAPPATMNQPAANPSSHLVGPDPRFAPWLHGRGLIGNGSPFAPVVSST